MVGRHSMGREAAFVGRLGKGLAVRWGGISMGNLGQILAPVQQPDRLYMGQSDLCLQNCRRISE